MERQAQRALGVDRALGAIAAETAIETAVRAVCDEVGSLEVEVAAESTWQMLTLPTKRGSVTAASVRARSVVAGGVRASSAELSFPEGVSVVLGTPTSSQPAAQPAAFGLPNLARRTPADFAVRFSQDDLSRSPVLFASLEALLQELLRSGASAAIGSVLPQDTAALRITLREVESLRDGRITLVADGTSTRADGSLVSLQGLRVRTAVGVSRVERMVVLSRSELLSTFEGLGARLEVGLPFLRGAGIPLPAGLTLEQLAVLDGAVTARGSVTLEPLDYSALLEQAQQIQADFAAPAATSATVDTEGVVEEQPAGTSQGSLPRGV